MRIQIDTEAKTIKIEEAVKLPELFSMVKKLLPNDEWKKYSLEQVVINNWWNPIYINGYLPVSTPFVTPFYGSTGISATVTTAGTDSAITSYDVSIPASNHVFNIEMN